MNDIRTTDQDVSRAIRSWLHADRHEDASRVAGAVLDQIEATPRRRATWWPARRTAVMNKIVGLGIAAAVMVVALFVGTQLLSSPGTSIGGPGVEPTPTSTVDPTSAPTPSPSAEGGLPVGPFLILDAQADDPVPALTVTIPAPGWTGGDDGNLEGGGILFKSGGQSHGAAMIIFVQPTFDVFGDPCNWATTPETSVSTVDEFVAALSLQPSRDPSEPVDITVGGYTGKSITLHVPNDADFSECDEGIFGSWNCGDSADPVPCGFHGDPGETDTEYILDVDGVIIAWHTQYADGTPADVVAELEAIVQSATFGE